MIYFWWNKVLENIKAPNNLISISGTNKLNSKPRIKKKKKKKGKPSRFFINQIFITDIVASNPASNYRLVNIWGCPGGWKRAGENSQWNNRSRSRCSGRTRRITRRRRRRSKIRREGGREEYHIADSTVYETLFQFIGDETNLGYFKTKDIKYI